MQIELSQPVLTALAPDLTQPLTNATKIKSAAGEFRVSQVQLTEGASAGVTLLLIDSGSARAAICPTRGMSLWKANVAGMHCGWNSPTTGPVHPKYVDLNDASGFGWLDGFDELVVRCGMQSFGAPEFGENGELKFPLHGRVGNLPARNVKINLDAEHSLLEITGQVLETRFMNYNLQLTAKYQFAFGQPTIEIHDVVTNGRPQAATMEMLYHINVGEPLLSEGAKFNTASPKIVARNERAAEDLSTWDSYQKPTTGYEEQVYFSQSQPDSTGWATALLSAADSQSGFAVHYDTHSLPYFTQWKNTVDLADGYVTGLEPGTGFPNPRSFEDEKGRVVQLAGGESIEFHLRLEGISDADRLRKLASGIDALRGKPAETLEFDPKWCTPRE